MNYKLYFGISLVMILLSIVVFLLMVMGEKTGRSKRNAPVD